jgi:hypothetical protein
VAETPRGALSITSLVAHVFESGKDVLVCPQIVSTDLNDLMCKI